MGLTDQDYVANTNRIVGGCTVKGVPWYVYIYMPKRNTNMRCGGTLINKFWVLSAAHCFCQPDVWPCEERTDRDKIRLFVGPDNIAQADTASLRNERRFDRDRPELYAFFIADIQIHDLYQKRIKKNGRVYERPDYDFALIRLDYPVHDEEHKIGILKPEYVWQQKYIMPICLPPLDFDESRRKAYVAGLGIQKEKHTCITNANGPEAYLRCADKWYIPRSGRYDKAEDLKMENMEVNEALKLYGNTHAFVCLHEIPPPISSDKLCSKFNNQLKKLRNAQKAGKLHKDSQKLKLLQHYNLTQESLLLPSENISLYMRSNNVNLSHCFPTTNEGQNELGWCATCNSSARPGEPGYCDEEPSGTKDSEIAIPSIDKGWGFCSDSCKDDMWNNKLQIVKLRTLTNESCKDIVGPGKKDHSGFVYTINTRAEICAGFISEADVSLVNVTKNATNGKEFSEFSILDYNKLEEKKPPADRSVFRSQKIKNNKDVTPLSKTSNKLIGGADSCRGDSGGPLWTIANITNHNNETLEDVAVLLGVVSRGKGCAAANRPGVWQSPLYMEMDPEEMDQ